MRALASETEPAADCRRRRATPHGPPPHLAQAVQHFRRTHPAEFAAQDRLAAADGGTVFRIAFQRRSNGMRLIRNLEQVLEVGAAPMGAGGGGGYVCAGVGRWGRRRWALEVVVVRVGVGVGVGGGGEGVT